MFAVVVSEKGGAERRELFSKAEVTVGRVQGNDLILPKGNVSKRHARLALTDGRFVVTDQNSTNGTYVNRRRISQATIVREGDRIYIGDFVLRIEPSDGRSGSYDSEIAEEPSSASPSEATGRYPAVPRSPRVPAEEQRRLRPSAPPPSGDRAPNTFEDSGEGESVLLRTAVQLLVAAVARGLEPRALDGEISDALRSDVERSLDERLRALIDEGAIEAQVDEDNVKEAAQEELLELGPIGRLLSDESVTQMAVHGTESLVVSRSDRRSVIEPPFSSAASLRRIVGRLCRRAGAPMEANEAIVERRLSDGLRLRALLGDATPKGPIVVIERAARHQATLEDLVRSGTISRAIATFLRQCVAGRTNILVVASKEAKGGLVLSALADAVRDGRVVAAVKNDELSVGGLDVTSVDVSDPAQAARAIGFAAELRDARLVIEQLVGEVAVAGLNAINQGTTGLIAGLPGVGLRRGLARLVADLSTANPSLAPDAIREWVASAFEIVIEVAELADGRQRVLRVTETRGVRNGEIEVADIFTFVIQRMATGGSIEGSFHATGNEPGITYELRARGVPLDSSLFSRPPSTGGN